jgi:CheY-like chemotaxis protein
MTKILIVDDEPHLVTLTKSRLQANGYAVISAYNGRECLDKAKSESPDLIMLDRMMPVLDGLRTLVQLKGDKDLESIPVVMFSAKVMPRDITDALSQGAIAYITKPFDPKKLIETIQEALK